MKEVVQHKASTMMEAIGWAVPNAQDCARITAHSSYSLR